MKNSHDLATDLRVSTRKLIAALNSEDPRKIRTKVNYYENSPENEDLFRIKIMSSSSWELSHRIDPLWANDKIDDWGGMDFRSWLVDYLNYFYMEIEEAKYVKQQYFGNGTVTRIDVSAESQKRSFLRDNFPWLIAMGGLVTFVAGLLFPVPSSLFHIICTSVGLGVLLVPLQVSNTFKRVVLGLWLFSLMIVYWSDVSGWLLFIMSAIVLFMVFGDSAPVRQEYITVDSDQDDHD